MTNKIKVFVGFLALIAAFSVYSVFNSLSGKTFPFAAIGTGNLLPLPDADADHDGLTNKEESYWNTDPNNSDSDGDGYLDGEETASGHDPLIPGPDDFLPTEDNLTMKMSQLALAGLYEGTLKSGNPNHDTALNDLAVIIADDAINSFGVDFSKIDLRIVASDNYSQQKYIEEFSLIYEELLKTFVEQMAELENNLNNIGAFGMAYGGVQKSFEGSSSRYEKIFDNLAQMAVPKNWKDSHLGVIKLAGELSQASQSLIAGQNDPIKAVVGLNKIVQLWEILPEITESYSNKIKLNRINPEQTIFK